MCYQSNAGVKCHIGTGNGNWSGTNSNLIINACSTGDASCEGAFNGGTVEQGDDVYPRIIQFDGRSTLQFVDINGDGLDDLVYRSEERRVGKECRL